MDELVAGNPEGGEWDAERRVAILRPLGWNPAKYVYELKGHSVPPSAVRHIPVR